MGSGFRILGFGFRQGLGLNPKPQLLHPKALSPALSEDKETSSSLSDPRPWQRSERKRKAATKAESSPEPADEAARGSAEVDKDEPSAASVPHRRTLNPKLPKP